MEDVSENWFVSERKEDHRIPSSPSPSLCLSLCLSLIDFSDGLLCEAIAGLFEDKAISLLSFESLSMLQ